MTAAESAFELMRPAGKDGTVRDLLLDRERLTGQRDERLDAAAIPPGCDALWTTFLTLHSRRNVTMAGAAPISLHDIEAWCRLYGVQLSPWEITTLLALDAAIVRKLNVRSSEPSS